MVGGNMFDLFNKNKHKWLYKSIIIDQIIIIIYYIINQLKFEVKKSNFIDRYKLENKNNGHPI